jgi:hypothetical protein
LRLELRLRLRLRLELRLGIARDQRRCRDDRQ